MEKSKIGEKKKVILTAYRKLHLRKKKKKKNSDLWAPQTTVHLQFKKNNKHSTKTISINETDLSVNKRYVGLYKLSSNLVYVDRGGWERCSGSGRYSFLRCSSKYRLKEK